MASVYQVLSIQGAAFPDSGFPAWTRKTGSVRVVTGFAYDATSTETCHVKGQWVNYGSGTCTVDITWWSDTSSTNAVTWGVAFRSVTPADASNIVTSAYDTPATGNSANGGQMYLNRTSIGVNNSGLDSAASGDRFYVAVYRMPSDGSDNLAADAVVEDLRLTYSDT